jgi:hypothetical protein
VDGCLSALIFNRFSAMLIGTTIAIVGTVYGYSDVSQENYSVSCGGIAMPVNTVCMVRENGTYKQYTVDELEERERQKAVGYRSTSRSIALGGGILAGGGLLLTLFRLIRPRGRRNEYLRGANQQLLLNDAVFAVQHGSDGSRFSKDQQIAVIADLLWNRAYRSYTYSKDNSTMPPTALNLAVEALRDLAARRPGVSTVLADLEREMAESGTTEEHVRTRLRTALQVQLKDGDELLHALIQVASTYGASQSDGSSIA